MSRIVYSSLLSLYTHLPSIYKTVVAFSQIRRYHNHHYIFKQTTSLSLLEKSQRHFLPRNKRSGFRLRTLGPPVARNPIAVFPPRLERSIRLPSPGGGALIRRAPSSQHRRRLTRGSVGLQRPARPSVAANLPPSHEARARTHTVTRGKSTLVGGSGAAQE